MFCVDNSKVLITELRDPEEGLGQIWEDVGIKRFRWDITESDTTGAMRC